MSRLQATRGRALGHRSRSAALLAAAVLAATGAALRAGWVARATLGPRLGAGYLALIVAVLALGTVAALVVLGTRGSRRRPRGAAVWRLALVVATLGAAVYLSAFQPFRRVTFDLALGVTAALLGVLLAFGGALAARLPARLVAALDVALFNLCALALGLELTLRATALLGISPLLAQVDNRVEAVVARRHLVPGTLRFGFPVNAHGHYDDPFPAAGEAGPRVVSIGDSFSAGVVPHHFHFTTVAERLLGVPVLNLGFAAAGPYEYRYLLRHEVPALGPDLVVVNLFIGNDLRDVTKRGTRDRRLRLWFHRDNLLLVQVPRRLARLARERRGTAARRDVGGVQGAAEARRIDGRAALLEAFPWLADPGREVATYLEESYLRVETERAVQALDAPPWQYRRLYRLLGSMRRAAGGVPLAVVLIPDEMQVEDPLWAAVSARLAAPIEERDRPQRLLRQWLDAQGIPCLDLLPVLRREPTDADGRRRLYHRRDSHWNARGNAVAGTALARFLAPLLGLGERDAVPAAG